MALESYVAKWGEAFVYFGTSYPTVSTDSLTAFNKGDIVIQTTPTAGGSSNPMWMCVTAGRPGTWEKFAALAAV